MFTGVIGWSALAQRNEALALMNFAEAKFVEVRGFEPLAFSLRTRRSTN